MSGILWVDIVQVWLCRRLSSKVWSVFLVSPFSGCKKTPIFERAHTQIPANTDAKISTGALKRSVKARARYVHTRPYRSVSSIFAYDLWLLFCRGHSHLRDDGHIDLINSFIYCQSPPFMHTLSHLHIRTPTNTLTHTAKTHRLTAGITQLSASSIPHLLHVCFSVSLLFLFSSPQATSPSPLLWTLFNPFLLCPHSHSPLPASSASHLFLQQCSYLFVSQFSSSQLRATAVRFVSHFAKTSQEACDSNMQEMEKMEDVTLNEIL